jgi:predicted transcriptional regulator
MATALKTTVYLDAKDYERLKEIARADGRAPAEVVREAVAEYAQRHRRRGDVSERAEELLVGFGRSR